VTDDPKPKPGLVTTVLALQECIGCLTHAMAAGEVPNPVLAESMRLDLIRHEAVARRWLEETP
jgi:hypothetical protein